MSKKSQWKIMSSTNPTLLMSYEEKQEYEKNRKEYQRSMFKWGEAIRRMPTNKPKLTHNKPVKDPEDTM